MPPMYETPGVRPTTIRGGRFASPTPPGMEGLRGLYERYCDQEARALLQLIPRDGLRSLYRTLRARTAVLPEPEDPDPDQPAGSPDSLAMVVSYARDLLPLPPFHLWLDAYLADRGPFLEALGIEATPSRPDPVLVDVRAMQGGWMVGLHLFHREGEWRGFLQFTREVGGSGHRTADIFRAEEPAAVRARFREYTDETLKAFLRSVMP